MTITVSRKCWHKCAGGNACVCYADVRHELHICKEPLCECHDLPRVRTKTVVAGTVTMLVQEGQ